VDVGIFTANGQRNGPLIVFTGNLFDVDPGNGIGLPQRLLVVCPARNAVLLIVALDAGGDTGGI